MAGGRRKTTRSKQQHGSAGAGGDKDDTHNKNNKNKDDKKNDNEEQKPEPTKQNSTSTTTMSMLTNSIFSISNVVTILMIVYMSSAFKNMYKLMYPLTGVDLSSYSQDEFVKPLWTTSSDTATGAAGSTSTSSSRLYLRVYLSTQPRFKMEYLKAGYNDKADEEEEGDGGDDNNDNDEDNDDTAIIDGDVALLWDEIVDSTSPSFSKSFLLTATTTTATTATTNTCNQQQQGQQQCTTIINNDNIVDPSYQFATNWLDDAERMAIAESTGNIMNVVSAAGHGIESTSILLTFYQSFSGHLRNMVTTLKSLISSSSPGDSDDNNESSTSAASAANAAAANSHHRGGATVEEGILDRKTLRINPKSPLWETSIQSNSTLYVHVLVLRAPLPSSESGAGGAVAATTWPPSNWHSLTDILSRASRSNSLLTGQVCMIKFDLPHHVMKPSRILINDVAYVVQKYILRRRQQIQQHPPPWDMKYTKPTDYDAYQNAIQMKQNKVGYPYWKPEVAIKYVSDNTHYPIDYIGRSGMPIVQVGSPQRQRQAAASGASASTAGQQHPTGYSYTPAVHVDEIGLTSEKYIPVNETVTSLPLRISFDRSDVEHQHHSQSSSSATAGSISPARWRLLTHLSQALEGQKALGFDQSDIDDVRRLIADTNVMLLSITLLASALHLLFEFLTFKNDVSFWKNNSDLTGLSVRSLFLDVVGQTVILLYLIERDSSLLITVPSCIGVLIALWKCKRGAGLQFVPVEQSGDGGGSRSSSSWWNVIPRMFGYELRATRLEIHHNIHQKHQEQKGSAANDDDGNKDGDDYSHLSTKEKLTILSIESDRIATRTLGVFLLPLVVGYAIYSLVYEQHTGWYSWLVTSASSAVYALGFVLMTPQLFLNWKLKSVAHLPWRVLIYKSLNTFIDDLFSFIIRMPTMARISCFRDDVVFFIYLYQRWLYPVDTSRPIEGGGDGGSGGNASSSTASKVESTKKNQ